MAWRISSRSRAPPENSLRVSYGGATFAATSYSVVRITLDAPPGELAVFSGNVHLDRGDSLQLDIHGGESLNMDASDATRYNLTESIRPDSWDTWNADRDQALNAESTQQTAATSAYGTSNNVGMADLDANGNWYDVPGQGYLWSPYDAQAQGASWDPYGYGHWVFYPRYGWVSGSLGTAGAMRPSSAALWNYYRLLWLGLGSGHELQPMVEGYGGYGGGYGGYGGYGGGGWLYNLGRGYLSGISPSAAAGLPSSPAERLILRSDERCCALANVVPVDRRTKGDPYQGLGARPNPIRPVTIAGHTVEPLKADGSVGHSYARTGRNSQKAFDAILANGMASQKAPSRPAFTGLRLLIHQAPDPASRIRAVAVLASFGIEPRIPMLPGSGGSAAIVSERWRR